MPRKPLNPLADYLGSALVCARADPTMQNLLDRVDRLRGLRARWSQVVPLPLRSHVRPAHFDGGTLLLEADSPAWAARAHHQNPALIERLACCAEFAGITGIRIRVSPAGAARPSRGTRELRIPPGTAELLATTADTVSDPKLKAALRRLAATAQRAGRPCRRDPGKGSR